jgi:NCS1 family nucleobase:cation symporter-1
LDADPVALFSALVVGSDDPTEWMVPLGGPVMGVLALCFVAPANVALAPRRRVVAPNI